VTIRFLEPSIPRLAATKALAAPAGEILDASGSAVRIA
jgi:hypothetical protein